MTALFFTQVESISSIKKKSSNNPVKGLMSFMFERKKSKHRDSKDRSNVLESKIESGYSPLFEDLNEDSQKVHFIVGHGILRPEIR